MTRKDSFGFVIVVLLILYGGSYLTLSRLGIAQAAQYDSEFYYFLDPTSEAGEDVHTICCSLYAPLIQSESLLGSRYYPGTCCHLRLS